MTRPTQNLRIDGQRLWDSLMQMAQIGPGVAGGNNRQTLTDADGEARHLFARWCAEAGLTMAVDTMGNMFATRAGTDPDAAPVCMGSHLDTQPTGGKYDGVLGVLGALEALRTMNDLGLRTRRPVVAVNWTNEEGTRFAPALLSSGTFVGEYDRDWAYAREDVEGARFGTELERIGWKGDEPVGARKMHAMFELHIEQGPILEAAGLDVGVVTHGQGMWWLRVTMTGKDAHAGSTPMHLRADAGLGMARLIERVNQVALAHQPDAVGTVGQANVHPNSTNVVPGRSQVMIDLRSPDKAKLDAMKDEVARGAMAIARQLGLGCEVEVVGNYDPITFDPACVAMVRRAAGRLGYGHRDMVSGAGHDACMISRVAPTAMIFCPCVDGLSHNEAEEITPDWAAAGTDVLLHSVLEAAELVP